MIEYGSVMKLVRELVITILIALALYLILRVAVQGYTVQHSSMLPNIEEGEWIMVSKARYFFSNPQQGDVVVFDPPISSEHPFIKRVIGLPNDTVEVRDGKVIINGIPMEEDYVAEPPHYNMPPKKIPDDEYFVLGDNRNHSNDSHSCWTVPSENIVGKAWFVYWPPSKWGSIEDYKPESGTGNEVVAVCVSSGGAA